MMSEQSRWSRFMMAAGLSLSLIACGADPADPGTCAARFASLSRNPLIGTTRVRSTYTFELDTKSAMRVERLLKGGKAGAPTLTFAPGDTGSTLRNFKAKPVDARGAVLIAERRYFRVRPDRVTTVPEAVTRGCSLLGPGATLLAIDLAMVQP